MSDQAVARDSPEEDELVRAQLAQAETKRRKGRKRLIMIAVSVVVIGVVFAVVLPKIANYRDVWKVIQGMSWEWSLVLLGAVVLNIVTNGPPWMSVLPGLGFFHSLRMTQASIALSIVAPGGPAVAMATSFGMLKAWGFEGRPVGLAVALTSIWNELAICAFPIVAVAGLAAHGDRNKTLEWVALISLAVFAAIVAGGAVVLQSAHRARRMGDWSARTVSRLKALIRKRPVSWTGEAFVGFRAEAIDLLRRRWHVLTITTVANYLTTFVLLVVSLRAIDVTRSEVSIVEAFAAWTLARVLGSIPITPGGLGIVELGLTGALVGFGASNAQAVAGTLLYRFLQNVPTLLLGLVSAATYRLHTPSASVSRDAGAAARGR